MKNTVSPSNTWSYTVLGDHNFRDNRNVLAFVLGLWTRLTSPPDAKPGATFAERDRVRRGRIASSLMFFLAILLGLAAPIGVFTPNHSILGVVVTIYIVIAICIPFNRGGLVNVVGTLLSMGIVFGMYTSILTAKGGMSPAEKDILYLLFFSELFAGAILPINCVFLVALINILFSFEALTYAPHTPALAALLATGYSTILFRIIQIHFVVSLVMWILVKTMQEHIKRADRAEELARLQHAYAQLTERQAQEKKALEQSISLITQVHTRVANGDLNARVPLIGDHVLWHVGGQLNNLLSRYQKALQELARREQLSLARQRIVAFYPVFSQAVSTAERSQRPLEIPTKTGTALDPYLKELNGKYLSTRPCTDSTTSQLV
jgi:uncharacterized membrane protein